jgi:DNA helicase-2/ATP-dependent DNA helicase PcrA
MQLIGRMKKNKLIIAAAGSGKTRTLIERALDVEDGNVLITTFTEANAEGIVRKILEKTVGYVPLNITVQTWFSFLLQHGVRPYQSIMSDGLSHKKIGFFLISASSSVRKGSGGKIYSLSEEKDFYRYYFISVNNLKIYSDKISEFSFKCDGKTAGDVIKRISRIYPNIFIDEVQDLAGWDLDFLNLLFDSNSNILLVGDPRQGTYSTNNSRKNKKFQRSQIINFFEKKDLQERLDVDTNSLTVNYRSNKKICDFSNYIFPDYNVTSSGQMLKTDHDGVFFVKEANVDAYLEKYSICMQLRNDIREKRINKNYHVMNFGESKGLDFDRVLIFPTTPIINWIKDHSSELAPTSRCKFYVASTRARYSVGIVYNYTDSDNIEGVEKFVFNNK